MGIDPDAAQDRAKKFGATIVQEARIFRMGGGMSCGGCGRYVWHWRGDSKQ